MLSSRFLNFLPFTLLALLAFPITGCATSNASSSTTSTESTASSDSNREDFVKDSHDIVKGALDMSNKDKDSTASSENSIEEKISGDWKSAPSDSENSDEFSKGHEYEMSIIKNNDNTFYTALVYRDALTEKGKNIANKVAEAAEDAGAVPFVNTNPFIPIPMDNLKVSGQEITAGGSNWLKEESHWKIRFDPNNPDVLYLSGDAHNGAYKIKEQKFVRVK